MIPSSSFPEFTARLREFMRVFPDGPAQATAQPLRPTPEDGFDRLARELFELQFHHNVPYRRLCEARHVSPASLRSWDQIPAVPAAAFKELELSCLAPGQRTAVFHSSGTTVDRPSRHFHSTESLAVYAASLLPSFRACLFPELEAQTNQTGADRELAIGYRQFAILTPPPAQAPHSSLVYMFEVIRREFGAPERVFCGRTGADDAWTLDAVAACNLLRKAGEAGHSMVILGTAFSFVHLLDYMAQRNERFNLPPGSRAMETGGYKGRSRILPRAELHELITLRLGIPPSHIVCEYGMSELSSQAYDHRIGVVGHLSALLPEHGHSRPQQPTERGHSCPQQRSMGRMEPTEAQRLSELAADTNVRAPTWCEDRSASRAALNPEHPVRIYSFPPWARAQIISPETGCAVAEGESGLIRVFDLANVYSVMAIQTEDLGIHRGDGFELIGRARMAEPRGCSLMAS
jgi:hypothetical protein